MPSLGLVDPAKFTQTQKIDQILNASITPPLPSSHLIGPRPDHLFPGIISPTLQFANVSFPTISASDIFQIKRNTFLSGPIVQTQQV
jgi:hypothetical protein